MKLLVTGGYGAFALALRQYFPSATYLTHRELDVRDAEACERVVLQHQPTHILHAAAITDHQCPDVGLLIATNVIGTQHMVMAAEQVEAKLIYLSTHYVYPGETGRYTERSPCHPIGTYAWTKYAGEKAAYGYAHDMLIVRGSWYTEQKLRLWEKGALVDALTNREPVGDAAEKVAKLIDRNASGIVNIGGETRSFFNLLRDEGRAAQPVTRWELNQRIPYPFPADSSVDTTKYRGLVVA